MGDYEDQPGHVEVVEQVPPPVPQWPNGGTAVPGIDPTGTPAAVEPGNEAAAYADAEDDESADDES
jgi:hypothetical protein